MMGNNRILLVGCGKMGRALLTGIINSGWHSSDILIITPKVGNAEKEYGAPAIDRFIQETVQKFSPDIIIFAVKPQIIEKILPDYRQFAEKSLFISVIAGKTIDFFSGYLGNNVAFIRTMPNLPVIVGKGITGWYKNQNVSDRHTKIFVRIFAASGFLQHVEKEGLLDVITAISGSGPAYVCSFIECLAVAAAKLGLPEDMAADLAFRTFEGSIELLKQSHSSPSGLRIAVTSPGGTTEAALSIFMQDDVLQELVDTAAGAAYKKSVELSQ